MPERLGRGGWGLDPLDGADAAGDPDEDRVSNLREFQVGNRPPCGGYQVEELVIAGWGTPRCCWAGGDGSLLSPAMTPAGAGAGSPRRPTPAAPGAFGVAPCGAGGRPVGVVHGAVPCAAGPAAGGGLCG
jgi:hypothetical protein